MKNSTKMAVSAVVLTFLTAAGCPKCSPIIDTMPMATPGVVIDDMEDADNRSSTANTDFTGGYWYTYDDLAAPNNGDSVVWPMSGTAMSKYGYPNPVATFQMTSPGAGASAYCARISGNVTTTYMYGFIGMGFDLMDGGTAKIAVNLSELGYTRLKFAYKNGPSVTGNKEWKVKLVSNAHGFTDACDMPVRKFTASGEWQVFDYQLSVFAQEGWCSNSSCPTGVNSSQCYPVTDFIAAAVAFQFQTDYRPGTADLLIDNIGLVK